MSLHDLQNTLIQALFQREQVATASCLVKTQGQLSSAQRVGIYRNSTHGILLDYLESLYPVCLELVGSDFFGRAAHTYIDQEPPTTPFLAEYGKSFPEHLASLPAMQDLLWIAEVAKLEWARQTAWHSVNQAVSDFTQLEQLSEQQQLNLRFQLPATAQLISSTAPIHSIWLAHQAEDYPDKPSFEAIDLQQAEQVLVLRQQRQLLQIQLHEDEWQFLSALYHQLTMNELAEQFVDQLPWLLSSALQNGWIHSFTTE